MAKIKPMRQSKVQTGARSRAGEKGNTGPKAKTSDATKEYNKHLKKGPK